MAKNRLQRLQDPARLRLNLHRAHRNQPLLPAKNLLQQRSQAHLPLSLVHL